MKIKFADMLLFVLLAALSTGGGCGDCHQDFSTIPEVGFLRILHRVYRTKRELFVVTKNRKNGSSEIEIPGEAETPRSINDFYADPARWSNIQQGARIAGVLPAGTLIHIDKLIAETCDTGLELPFATVLNGDYAGTSCVVYNLVNDPSDANVPEWTIKSDYLDPN